MESVQISAQVRDTKKKSASRALRREGKIPGIVYGPDIEPIAISVKEKDLLGLLKRKGGKGVLIELSVEADASTESRRCLLKEIQWEPIKGKPIHVDLYAISRAHEIGMDIPINFVNTPLGVTKGGIFEPVLRELKVHCLLENMIDRIDIDVSPLDIGDSLHVKDLNLPAGIKVKLLEDEVVATVLPPSGEGESEGSGPTGPDAG